MPKTLIAKNVADVNTLHFTTSNGVVTGLTADVEVNYGERGMSEQIELYSRMSPSEHAQIQSIYNRIKMLTTKAIMD